MKEREFQGWVVDVAQRLFWMRWHVPAPMRRVKGGEFIGAREAAGLSDLILVNTIQRRLIFAEVKGEGGKLSDAQQEFLLAIHALHLAGVESYAWRPGMENEIEEILRGK